MFETCMKNAFWMSLVSLAFMLALTIGCSGSSETGLSSSGDEVQQFLDENPELAEADLEPPPDPE